MKVLALSTLIIVLLQATWTDLKEHLVPPYVWLTLGSAGLLNRFYSSLSWRAYYRQTLLALLLPLMLMLLSLLLSFRGDNLGLGMGDIKLLFGLCFWFSLESIILILFIACYLATLVMMGIWLTTKLAGTTCPKDLKTPLVPFITLGVFVCMIAPLVFYCYPLV